MQSEQKRWNPIVVLVLVFVLGAAPLLLLRDTKFEGADSQAAAAIETDHPQYQPWFKPIAEPVSGEVESLLFALQASSGAGLLGYIMGLYRGRQEANRLSSLSSEASTDANPNR